MIFKIRQNPIVYDDLKSIYDYLSKDSVDIAQSLVNEIIEKFDSLKEMPNRGIKLKDKIRKLKQKDMLYIIFKNYYIFYLVREDTVIIYSVLHGSRNYIEVLNL